MDGSGPDSQIDIDVHRKANENVGAAVIGRRTFDLGVGSPISTTPRGSAMSKTACTDSN
jgi:hypothetical protein